MLKTKKLTKSYDTAVEAYHYEFGAISLYWKGRQLVSALFTSI